MKNCSIHKIIALYFLLFLPSYGSSMNEINVVESITQSTVLHNNQNDLQEYTETNITPFKFDFFENYPCISLLTSLIAVTAPPLLNIFSTSSHEIALTNAFLTSSYCVLFTYIKCNLLNLENIRGEQDKIIYTRINKICTLGWTNFSVASASSLLFYLFPSYNIFNAISFIHGLMFYFQLLIFITKY